jgi:F420-0:gamma-glutamyl ligase
LDMYCKLSKRRSPTNLLASAAELVVGHADEAILTTLIRGYKYKNGGAKAAELIMSKEKDLFR